MVKFQDFIASLSGRFVPVLDARISKHAYMPIDLASDNPELAEVDLTNVAECQHYIDGILKRNSAQVAYGGYLEKRSLYKDHPVFIGEGKSNRDIHLGMDFWSEAGTQVQAPLRGTVHSFQNNPSKGDYGPTIILRHGMGDAIFHTLYGHLSLESLDGLFTGKEFQKGEVLGTLGTPDINVHYAPHLHFQVILDLQDHEGDYPGVCAEDDLDFYRHNCPNPSLLLGL